MNEGDNLMKMNNNGEGDNVNCQVDTKELFPDECLIHEVIFLTI